MTLSTKLFWALFAVTLAVYLAILVWSLPAIAAEADGLRPFDLRPQGYSFDEAREFLTALSDRGRELYLGPQQWLDTAYPLLLALTLSLAFLRLAPPGRVWLALLAAAIACAGTVFDLMENAQVRALLRQDPAEITAEAVAAASNATVVKSLCHTAAFVALILLFVAFLRRRARERRGA